MGLDAHGAVDRATTEQQAVRDREAGTLLIRDAGSPADTRWVDDREDLPRIIRAGRHIARTRRYIRNFAHEIEPEDLAAYVRQEARRGDGWVKLVGDWIDRETGDLATCWPREALVAAVAAAHAEGARVTAHCFGEESLRDFAAAGTDCIEHATGLQPDTIDTFAAQGIAIVPTLVNIDTFPGIAGAAEGKFPTLRRAPARPALPALRDRRGRPRRRGADLPRHRRRRLPAARAGRRRGGRAGQGRPVGRRGPRGRDLGGPPVAGPPGTGRGRERRPGGLPGRPAQGHRRARRAVARGAARPGCLLSRLPCARRGSGSGSARSPRTTSRRTALAVEQSRDRLSQWNPVNADDLGRHLAAQGRDHRTFVIHARAPEGGHDLVGKVNVTNVVRGRFLSAAMGYDAYDPYAGRGLFAEGLRLVVGLVLAAEPGGMGLHRLEASVQPGNTVSAGLLRSLGFQREGSSPRMLWLPDARGTERWRDHDSYAMTAEDWPAAAYAPAAVRPHRRAGQRRARVGQDHPGAALARELSLPLLSKDLVKESVADALPAPLLAEHGAGHSALGRGANEALWALLGASPTGGVVESWFWPQAQPLVAAGLDRAGFAMAAVPEVWCDVPLALARERFEARACAGSGMTSTARRPG